MSASGSRLNHVIVSVRRLSMTTGASEAALRKRRRVAIWSLAVHLAHVYEPLALAFFLLVKRTSPSTRHLHVIQT